MEIWVDFLTVVSGNSYYCLVMLLVLFLCMFYFRAIYCGFKNMRMMSYISAKVKYNK